MAKAKAKSITIHDSEKSTAVALYETCRAAAKLRRIKPNKLHNLEPRAQIVADNVFGSGGSIKGCFAVLAGPSERRQDVRADNASSRKRT